MWLAVVARLTSICLRMDRDEQRADRPPRCRARAYEPKGRGRQAVEFEHVVDSALRTPVHLVGRPAISQHDQRRCDFPWRCREPVTFLLVTAGGHSASMDAMIRQTCCSAVTVLLLIVGCYRQEMRDLPETCGNDYCCMRAIARHDLRSLQEAIRIYQLRHGAPPTNSQGLQALVDDGILLGIPRDPWGRRYIYGVASGHPLLSSLGADGRPGGEEANEDIFEPAPQTVRSPSNSARSTRALRCTPAAVDEVARLGAQP